MSVIDHMILSLQLLEMNATGRHATLTPPCEDLPTFVHLKDGTRKRRNDVNTASRQAVIKNTAKYNFGKF